MPAAGFSNTRAKRVIVCQCNRLSSDDVEWTVRGLAEVDPHRRVSALTVFAACGRRPKCGNCIRLITRLIEEARMPTHEEADTL